MNELAKTKEIIEDILDLKKNPSLGAKEIIMIFQKKMDSKIKNLERIQELHSKHCKDRPKTNKVSNDYMVGLYNGLEMALSSIKDEDAKFKE